MMDEKYFPDPTEFNPDNFHPDKKKERSPYAFHVFGIGPREAIQ